MRNIPWALPFRAVMRCFITHAAGVQKNTRDLSQHKWTGYVRSGDERNNLLADVGRRGPCLSATHSRSVDSNFSPAYRGEAMFLICKDTGKCKCDQLMCFGRHPNKNDTCCRQNDSCANLNKPDKQTQLEGPMKNQTFPYLGEHGRIEYD